MRIYSLLLFLISLSAWGQHNLTKEQLEKLAKIATQDVPPKAPGIATAIISNGKVIFEKYAGYANLEDSTLINRSSRFNIASNGKQFTALAILLLADAKKLNLTDDIRMYFPELYPTIKDKIAINNLLNHTSGIRDFYDLLSLQGITWWEKNYTNADILDIVKRQEELNFPPGSTYAYSNTNYVLLALLVEKVSKESFTTFTRRMFDELNMVNTSFVDDASKIEEPIAKSYFNFNTWTTYNWIWNVCGDGNIFSTLKDQIQWELVVQGKAEVKISKRVIEQSQSLIPNSIKNYGYGLEFGTYKNMAYKFHEGATGAWKATVVRLPTQNTSFITLTNTGKSIPYTQTRQMVDVVYDLKSDKEYLVTKPKETGPFIDEAEVVGTYLTPENFAFQFVNIENKIYLKRIGRNDVELVRESDNVFNQKYDPDFKQEFRKNQYGELEVTAYYINHSPYTLKKISNTWDNFDFKSIEGEYFSSETGVTISIRHKNDSEFDIKIGDNYKTTGLLVSKTKMLIDFYTVDFDQNGKTDKIYLSGDRIKNVVFTKK
jgi:CubicO group peptidase (beta-lactamase class C family)